MHLKALLPGLLTTTVMALPTDVAARLDLAHGDMEVFRRDSALNIPDVELAQVHGVNLTDMFKHSIIKRDDGDDITVWVNRAFIDTPQQDLVERQSVRLGNEANFKSSMAVDWCRDHKRDDHTGPNGPYSGGVQAIFRWANEHEGYFSFGDASYGESESGWQNFVIAGSNSGANALYRARLHSKSPPNWYEKGVGSQDVRNDADWTQNKARKFGSSWRASSRGSETCGWPGEGSRGVSYELIRSKYDV